MPIIQSERPESSWPLRGQLQRHVRRVFWYGTKPYVSVFFYVLSRQLAEPSLAVLFSIEMYCYCFLEVLYSFDQVVPITKYICLIRNWKYLLFRFAKSFQID